MAEAYQPAKAVEETTLSLLERRFVILSTTGRVELAIRDMTLLLKMIRALPEFREDKELTGYLTVLEDQHNSPQNPAVPLRHQRAVMAKSKMDICLQAWGRYHELKQKHGLGIERKWRKIKPFEEFDWIDIVAMGEKMRVEQPEPPEPESESNPPEIEPVQTG